LVESFCRHCVITKLDANFFLHVDRSKQSCGSTQSNVPLGLSLLGWGGVNQSKILREDARCKSLGTSVPRSKSRRHQIACFKVTAKSHNVSTRTAELRWVKTAQNSQRSKASNAVLLTWSRAVRGAKSFRGLEACNLVTLAIMMLSSRLLVGQKSVRFSWSFHHQKSKSTACSPMLSSKI
jgi:hypothetical protein